MKRLYLTTEMETYEEQRAAGRYNPAMVVVWMGERIALSAGDSDSLYFWAESGELYVLAINYRFNYIGLESTAGNDFFSQNPTETFEREDIMDMSPAYILRRCLEYCW